MENNIQTLVQDYKAERENLLKEAFDLKFGTTPFTETDFKANEIFERIQKQTRDTIPEQFHYQAVKYIKQAESSHLYKLLKEMPKGSLHHIHISFYTSSTWFVQKALLPCFYIDKAGKIGAFDENPGGEWTRISELREQATDKARFDKDFEDNFHMTEEEMASSNVWAPFQFKIANRLAICYRPGIWKEYILETCYLAIEEGFSNLQIRTYVPTAEEKNFGSADDEIQVYKDCEKEAQKRDPNFTVAVIFVGLRFWSNEKIESFLTSAREIKKKYSDLVIGYDLVAEEKLRGALDFAPLFLEHAKKAESEEMSLPPILHGGESLDLGNTNLYDLYLYKSKRVGHGINLFKHPYLYAKVKEQGMCFEVNPLSNQILKYVADLRVHPAIGYHNYGIKISLSPDDPGLFQTNTILDFFAACLSFEFNLLDFKRVTLNSIESSCMDEKIQNNMLKDWEQKWDLFVKRILEIKE